MSVTNSLGLHAGGEHSKEAAVPDADADTAQTATCRSLKRRGKGKRVRGELYVVSTETLAGIDEYEVRTREKNFLLRCVFN